MCLDTVDRVYKTPLAKEVVVWKAFDQRYTNDPIRDLRISHNSEIVTRGKWMKSYGQGKTKRIDYTTYKTYRPTYKQLFEIARGRKYVNGTFHNNGTVTEQVNNTYPAGFHAYAVEPMRHIYRTFVKVKLRGIVCVGVQGKRKVYVARELYVPKVGEKI